jgi:PAS domain S-box-containing protein
MEKTNDNVSESIEEVLKRLQEDLDKVLKKSQVDIGKVLRKSEEREKALMKSQEQLNTIFSNLKDTVFVISEDYKVLFKNDTAHDIFGTELIGKDCYNVIKGQDQPCERCPMKTFAESDLCLVRFEQCVNTPFLEGERVFDIVSSPIENYAGQPAMLEVLRDNTERVKMEAEIRKLSAYNRNLIETSLDPLVTISPDGKITDVSRATEIITGRSREELIGTEFSSYFTEPERASEVYKKVFETGSVQDYELEIQHVNGHITPVMYNASIFKDEADNVVSVFAAARDITEQKKAEQILKKSLEQLDTIFSNLKDTVFVISEDYKILFKNDTAHDIFGKELIGKDCYKVIKGQDQPCERCPMKAFAESDLCLVRFEQCVNTPFIEGERVFDIVSSPIENYAGQPAILEILRDNTENINLQEELKKHRDHLEYMVGERIKELNCLYGLSNIIEEKDVIREEILKRTVELFPPAWQFPDVTCARIIVDSQEYKTENFKETKWKQASNIIVDNEKVGTVEIYYLEEKPEFDEGPFLKEERGLIDAITERLGKDFERINAEEKLKEYSEKLEEMVEQRTKELKDAQAELVQKERLAVLGKLAGGVGHELRNPLAAIKNAAYFLNMVLEDLDPQVKESLQIIEEEINSSEKIINGLLGYARPKPPNIRKVKINSIIQEVLSRTNIPENIEVINRLDAALPSILADPDQLKQVFGNIILNAIQAMPMPEGGQLIVKTEVQSQEEITISFTDTGVGISEEGLSKLFEPLYTTKAKGIGLGLAICKTIIEKHKGSIEVKSEIKKGSTFSIKLPFGKRGVM